MNYSIFILITSQANRIQVAIYNRPISILIVFPVLNTELAIYDNYISVFLFRLLFLPVSTETEYGTQILLKIPSIQLHEKRAVGSELFHAERETDRHTTKLTVDCSQLFCDLPAKGNSPRTSTQALSPLAVRHQRSPFIR